MKQQPVHFEFHIPIEQENSKPLDSLCEQTGLSRQSLKQVMQKGAVWLTHKGHTQRLRRASRTVDIGDTLHIYYDKAILDEQPTAPELITDEGAYSIWYKPYGMRSQGSKWGDHCTIHRWVEQHLEPQRPAFIVHRLDRAATGLIIIAHQKKVAAGFGKLFEQQQIDKRYRVIVHGRFPQKPRQQAVLTPIDGRTAKSQISFMAYNEEKDCSLLDVRIETGRKHQIRRHCAELNYPVVGDRLYGRTTDPEDLQLTSCYLKFICPVTGKEKQYRLDESLRPDL